MTQEQSEPVSFNVWGNPVEDIEAAVAALQDDSEGTTDGNAENSATPPTTDKNDGAAFSPEEAFKKWQSDMLEAFDKGDTSNPYYKGMQRVVERKNSHIERLEKLVTNQAEMLERLGLNQEQMGEGFNWLTETTLGALNEEHQTKASANLSKRELAFNQRKLEEQRKKQEAAARSAEQAGSDEEPPEIRQYKADFLKSRQTAAVKAGLKADDARLDYGDPNKSLLERLEVFEASLQKALDEDLAAREAAVSQTSTPVGTRGSGGGTPKTVNVDGLDALQRGARNRLQELRRASGV